MKQIMKLNTQLTQYLRMNKKNYFKKVKFVRPANLVKLFQE